MDFDPNATAPDIAAPADAGRPFRKPWIRPLIEQCNIAETEIAKVGVVAEGGTSIS